MIEEPRFFPAREEIRIDYGFSVVARIATIPLLVLYNDEGIIGLTWPTREAIPPSDTRNRARRDHPQISLAPSRHPRMGRRLTRETGTYYLRLNRKWGKIARDKKHEAPTRLDNQRYSENIGPRGDRVPLKSKGNRR